jgi:hypothetical protein
LIPPLIEDPPQCESLVLGYSPPPLYGAALFVALVSNVLGRAVKASQFTEALESTLAQGLGSPPGPIPSATCAPRGFTWVSVLSVNWKRWLGAAWQAASEADTALSWLARLSLLKIVIPLASGGVTLLIELAPDWGDRT